MYFLKFFQLLLIVINLQTSEVNYLSLGTINFN